MGTKRGTKRPDVALRNATKKQKDAVSKSWATEPTERKRKISVAVSRSLIGTSRALGHKVSSEARATISAKNRGRLAGSKHPNWKGGVTPINRRLRCTGEYKEWRSSVFERDCYTCQLCFKRGGYLEAHHIVCFISNPELRTDIQNGCTLCKKCHSKTKGKETMFEKILTNQVRLP